MAPDPSNDPVIDRRHRSWNTAELNSSFRTIILACLVATMCYLAAKLGGALVIKTPQTLWPLWPGCALLVAVLLVVPRKTWPILIPAGLAGFLLYDLQAGLSIHSIVWLILADTLEVLVAAWGVSYSLNGLPRLNSLKALAKYSFFTVILAPVIVSSIGVLGLNGDELPVRGIGIPHGHTRYIGLGWRSALIPAGNSCLLPRGRRIVRCAHYFQLWHISVSRDRSAGTDLFSRAVPTLVRFALRLLGSRHLGDHRCPFVHLGHGSRTWSLH
jgi:hypothetical protein